MMTKITHNVLTLADWRRQVSEIYAEVRHNSNAEKACQNYRRKRDALFTTHPQSPLDEAQKSTFRGLPYFPYNPNWRLMATVDPNVTPETLHVHLPRESLSVAVFW